MNDLAAYIQSTPLVDSHEHLHPEEEFVRNGPDVLQDLFNHYARADLLAAGADPAAVERLADGADPDLRSRFEGVRAAWERCRFNGNGEAVRSVARLLYGMEEITPGTLEAARERNAELRRPGQRLRILRDMARIDHVQVDGFRWECSPDLSGPDFFLYDLSWYRVSAGQIDFAALRQETGVEVVDLNTLSEAFAGIFAKYAPVAIAVKSQYAYCRPLRWEARADGEAAPILQKALKAAVLTPAEQIVLGDWCLARGVELAIAHALPLKIHTGTIARANQMRIDETAPGVLCELLLRYPQARFILMHAAYPFGPELAAMARHYTNVYVDLCWAWSIDPHSTRDFVRRMIHAAPIHKLFAFGGDTFWPGAAWAFAIQARAWLTRALRAEVDEGLLTEREALGIAARLMQGNQKEFFDLERTRGAIRARMGAGRSTPPHP